jgi:hypothetical protein
MKKVRATLTYVDDHFTQDKTPVVLTADVPSRFWASRLMERIPWGARIVSAPRIVVMTREEETR